MPTNELCSLRGKRFWVAGHRGMVGSAAIGRDDFAPLVRKASHERGPLEPTNERCAIAKIAGIKLTQAYRRQAVCEFISAMPTNLYGPQDNVDLRSSHVLPALIRKAGEAKRLGQGRLEVWGSRSPLGISFPLMTAPTLWSS